MFRTIALAAALLLPMAAAQANDPIQDEIRIEQAWSRATPGAARTGAAYVTVVNNGKTDDRIVAASSPVAEAVELHTMERDGDRMRMRPVEAVAVPAGGSAALKPGAEHIMLIGLHRPLKEGETFTINLVFEKHGTRAVDVTVAGVGAAGPGPGAGAGPGAMGHGSMNHGTMDHGAKGHGMHKN